MRGVHDFHGRLTFPSLWHDLIGNDPTIPLTHSWFPRRGLWDWTRPQPPCAADRLDFSPQAEHLYYQHESIARAVHKAQAFTNKWGKTEDLHPACTVASASAPSDGALDVTRGHPAAFLGQPSVDHEHVRVCCCLVFRA